ncbi:TPMT family class I SAM-dependent methyltransferase [Fulvivirga maritima]|uniref:TPMT family class I SAM-dependent methyltransferase n=1 Tax=Fulvivirga maritima TaxID=2904247 RepID=UPI001F24EEE2|nr:TPMT family class I SAM-dependent methyltransferase [Fulvivirga maritima]UII24758.1 TPMT family class I SAM-dependent methyltransferase [Fulvivirga maritima]
MLLDENYWTNRYNHNDTPWDANSITTPLKTYFDQLQDTSIKILIPGAGNAHEAAYLYEKGFKNVYIADISSAPLMQFQSRYPSFPKSQLLHQDFFNLMGNYDLIVEQTFFCALDPSLREPYAHKCAELLTRGGKLMGVLFNTEFHHEGPPFGGSKEEYVSYFEPYFNLKYFEVCYNSIKPRQGRELFILCEK